MRLNVVAGGESIDYLCPADLAEGDIVSINRAILHPLVTVDMSRCNWAIGEHPRSLWPLIGGNRRVYRLLRAGLRVWIPEWRHFWRKWRLEHPNSFVYLQRGEIDPACTTTCVLLTAMKLGYTELVCYGIDWEGVGGYKGRGKHDPDRWIVERKQFEIASEKAAERGVTIERRDLRERAA